ncbi:MAG: cation transporter [Alphaproteobacteria bacterium]
MSACCHGEQNFTGADPRYRRVLWIVVAINLAMFALEIGAGAFADSRSLQADALDFLGDGLTYGLSLAVIGLAPVWRARAALAKGVSLLAMAAWVLGTTLHAFLGPGQPHAPTMGVVGFMALAANLTSVLLLMRWQQGDANVRSVWLCSRNDAIGNVAVLIAAAGVWGSATAWPDLVVALGMAGLFTWSAVQILRQAGAELQASSASTSASTLASGS